MKIKVLFILLFGLPLLSKSQVKENIKLQALMIVQSLMKEDYSSIIDKTYPPFVELAGGKEAMLELMDKGLESFREQKIKIDSVVIGNPGELYKAGKEFHVLIPETLYMSFPKGRIIGHSHLLGISNDEGLNWYFINLNAQLTNETIKNLIPNFNQDLKLPKDEPPVFLEN